ncbi:hypothetical protein WJ47_05610 [Burkholderia ubonensis]|uniref:NIPSNAP domain-containing protein n=2 Tax=Burkholderia cepacia complex TaxID=87882 RepID=A0AAW3MRQ5_9BURK|nr:MULTISPECIES: NIPSNAP family protein [Burkholderia cepacia complex]AOK20779.1 hypothetical protein WT26_34295 [Burkholderia cepacia]AOK27547.1 hypothetical protein WK67_34090 [Burkholderia ubonensis]KVC74429.1 hypothetical protein WI74_18125 [Burkholderia ubonensis]KVD27068.1 hypothetical protein WI82_14885 [Burkholderia ubonensis]KVK76127.1 hypothetical protein WJ44_16735 [Burkholderia ubonensis]
MIIELRTYKLKVGALEQYVRLYREHGYALQSRALGEPLGWYTVDGGILSTVISLWRYDSHEDRAQKRANLAANQDWQAYLREVSPLFEAMNNQFLVPIQLGAEART